MTTHSPGHFFLEFRSNSLVCWTDKGTLTEYHARGEVLQHPEVLNSYSHHLLKHLFAHSEVNTKLGGGLLFAVRPRLLNEATRKHNQKGMRQ